MNISKLTTYFSTSDGCTYQVKSDTVRGEKVTLIQCLDCKTKSGWVRTTEAHIKSMVGFELFKEVKE